MEPQMHMHTFDTHKLVKAFLGEGFKENQAEILVKSLVESREYDFDRLATRDQIDNLKGHIDNLDEKIEDIKVEMGKFAIKTDLTMEKFATKTDLAYLEEKLTAKIDNVEERLSAKIDNKINEATNRMIKWVIGLSIATLIGVVVPIIMKLF